ncbi:MAG: hypothetical protein AABY53_08415 [Bdellovibrionota bacterium]
MNKQTKRTIQQKMQIVNDLFIMAYETKKNSYRKKNPHASEKELNWMAYASIERGCR